MYKFTKRRLEHQLALRRSELTMDQRSKRLLPKSWRQFDLYQHRIINQRVKHSVINPLQCTRALILIVEIGPLKDRKIDQCDVPLYPLYQHIFFRKSVFHFQNATIILMTMKISRILNFSREGIEVRISNQFLFCFLFFVLQRMIQRGVLSCPMKCKCDELTRCGEKYPQP